MTDEEFLSRVKLSIESDILQCEDRVRSIREFAIANSFKREQIFSRRILFAISTIAASVVIMFGSFFFFSNEKSIDYQLVQAIELLNDDFVDIDGCDTTDLILAWMDAPYISVIDEMQSY